jgi:hypothetical protein
MPALACMRPDHSLRMTPRSGGPAGATSSQTRKRPWTASRFDRSYQSNRPEVPLEARPHFRAVEPGHTLRMKTAISGCFSMCMMSCIQQNIRRLDRFIPCEPSPRVIDEATRLERACCSTSSTPPELLKRVSVTRSNLICASDTCSC